jgi:threonine aldolase
MGGEIRIDLQSDTVTRPTQAMRKAMSEATVGDEQRGEDPTVNALCRRVCTLLGKEAAVFLPSGTMCNQIAILVHCRPGDEILAHRLSHVISSEGGGAAALAGAQVRPLDGPAGTFTAAELADGVRESRRNAPHSRLVAVEQTSNRGGGSIWSLDSFCEIGAVARRHGLALHMDGARLLNAAVASGINALEYARSFDSVWIDLSKGLACPIGAVLAGSDDFIGRAWVWKQRLGGAMRQAGIVAAAGLHALEHHVDRLAEDHANARLFAAQIEELAPVNLVFGKVPTNIVYFDVAETGLSAAEVSDYLLRHRIRIGAESGTVLRAVTHMDVSREDVIEAADTLARVLNA